MVTYRVAQNLAENGVINEALPQFAPLSDILQGSAATHFRCGGIISDCIKTVS